MARSKKTESPLYSVPTFNGYADAEITKNNMVTQFGKLKPKDQMEFLRRVGVGVQDYHPKLKYATCAKCGAIKKPEDFYVSTEATSESHITPICKECAKAIAQPKDKDGGSTDPTKDTMMEALDWLRKPFIDSVYNSSITTGKSESARDIFGTYMTLIQQPQYHGLNYRLGSDFYNVNTVISDINEEVVMAPVVEDAAEAFEKNKRDCQRILGYLPYESENASDQPYLYADLVGFLSSIEQEDGNMLQIRSMVGIVRWFLQAEKIDNTIASLSQNINMMSSNMGVIKNLQDTKQKIMDTISKMADENKLSLKSNRDIVKGSNTFTGKLKRLRDLDLRQSSVNGFDLETCKAMQQVANISDNAILTQLNLDESEWSDIVAEQRKMVTSLTDEKNGYQEAARILLKENVELRQTLSDNGLLSQDNLVNLNDIVNRYWIGDKPDEDDS